MALGILIVDLDGTVARCEDRLHHIKDEFGNMKPRPLRDWDAFHEAGCRAEPYPDVVELVNIINQGGYNVVVVTGRSSNFRVGTEAWLHKHIPGWNRLYMRGPQDFRPDTEYKAEIFRQLSRENVLAIFEDRDSVVQMARGMGFTVIQPNEGAF